MSRGLCTIRAGRLKQSFVARMIHTKKPPDPTEEDDSKPLKFSESKAHPRNWTVEKSFGSEHQQPWWKVLPISLTFSAILLWAVFRKENKIDEIIYRPIAELMEMEDAKKEEEKGK
ncbi:ubiquinol-cytochrome c reductase complex assembly factor 4 [Mantella aurantiaca]